MDINDIKLITSPEEIDYLKRDELFRYKCTYPGCENYNIVKFPGHHAKSRIENFKLMLCKTCSQKRSKSLSESNKLNAIEVKTVEDIIKLPRYTWIKYVCKNCGATSTVSYQGLSRLYLHERFLCTRCSFNSVFDSEDMLNTREMRYGTRGVSKNLYNYFGITFDSSWEFAYWIYCINNNIQIIRNPTRIQYYDCETKSFHYYYPDFIVDGRLVEIKGTQFFSNQDGNKKEIIGINGIEDSVSKSKYKCMIENNVLILSINEIKPILKYVYNLYGRYWMEQYNINSYRFGYFYPKINSEYNNFKGYTVFDINCKQNFIGVTPYDLFI